VRPGVACRALHAGVRWRAGGVGFERTRPPRMAAVWWRLTRFDEGWEDA
jgi:hypothetical protein